MNVVEPSEQAAPRRNRVLIGPSRQPTPRNVAQAEQRVAQVEAKPQVVNKRTVATDPSTIEMSPEQQAALANGGLALDFVVGGSDSSGGANSRDGSVLLSTLGEPVPNLSGFGLVPGMLVAWGWQDLVTPAGPVVVGLVHPDLPVGPGFADSDLGTPRSFLRQSGPDWDGRWGVGVGTMVGRLNPTSSLYTNQQIYYVNAAGNFLPVPRCDGAVPSQRNLSYNLVALPGENASLARVDDKVYRFAPGLANAVVELDLTRVTRGTVLSQVVEFKGALWTFAWQTTGSGTGIGTATLEAWKRTAPGTWVKNTNSFISRYSAPVTLGTVLAGGDRLWLSYYDTTVPSGSEPVPVWRCGTWDGTGDPNQNMQPGPDHRLEGTARLTPDGRRLCQVEERISTRSTQPNTTIGELHTWELVVYQAGQRLSVARWPLFLDLPPGRVSFPASGSVATATHFYCTATVPDLTRPLPLGEDGVQQYERVAVLYRINLATGVCVEVWRAQPYWTGISSGRPDTALATWAGELSLSPDGTELAWLAWQLDLTRARHEDLYCRAKLTDFLPDPA